MLIGQAVFGMVEAFQRDDLAVDEPPQALAEIVQIWLKRDARHQDFPRTRLTTQARVFLCSFCARRASFPLCLCYLLSFLGKDLASCVDRRSLTTQTAESLAPSKVLSEPLNARLTAGGQQALGRLLDLLAVQDDHGQALGQGGAVQARRVQRPRCGVKRSARTASGASYSQRA
jgi:hypothetical protein